MKSSTSKIIGIIAALSIIWTINKYSVGLYTMPFWLLILVISRLKAFWLTSALIISEFFIGIDTITIGPFSIIQLIAVIIIIKSIKIEKLHFLNTHLFVILLITFVYFTSSYYSYFHEFTFAPLNWVFIFYITIVSFSGKIEELKNYAWLAVLSISLTSFVNFIIHLSLGGVYAVKLYSFGNPNQIGFFCLISLPLIVFLFSTVANKNSKLLKTLFYFNSFYIIFSGSRLNSAILLIFFISMYFSPIKGFFINKRKLVIFALIAVPVVLSINAFNNFVFREGEKHELNATSFSSVEDLTDQSLITFTSARSLIYYDAIILIKEKPLFGNGFLSWNSQTNDYNTIKTGRDGSGISMHSTFLQYMAETGIIGLALYFFYLISILKTGKKLIKKSDYYHIGIIVFYVSLFMLIGSTLDNHSMSYAQLHFIAAIGVIFLYQSKKNRDETANSILYK